MRDFKKIKVWEKGHRFVLDIYKISSSFPKEELYGLTSQLRRAAVSVPTNIAEGCGRSSEAELARFFQIAAGSASEVEYLLLLAHDLHWLQDLQYNEITTEVTEIRRMLAAFIKRLQNNK